MKRASFLVAACIVLGSLVISGPATAFNHPKVAKQHHVELVTAFNKCIPGAAPLTHRPSLALPSCVPVASSANNPTHVLAFNLAGALSIDLKSMTGNFTVKIHSRGIFDNGMPYNGNLTATVPLRVTDNGCGPSPYDEDCTRTDFPLPIGLTCTNSICNPAAPNANSILPGTVEPGDTSSVEIGQITLLDPDGDDFARGGLFVR